MDSAVGRESDIVAFLGRAGWDDAARSPLAGDASARRYERLSLAGARAVLMDAPPGSGEEIRPFVEIAAHLRGIGLSAPKILAEDEAHGFLLLEDLGDGLIARLADDPEREVALYEAAAQVLAVLARAPCPDGLPVLDAKAAAAQIAPVFDWYAEGIGESQKDQATNALEAALARLGGPAQIMIHRDYHAENLLWLPGRDGVAKIGVLDFQLAHRGAAGYDLVSLVEDARRDVSDAARDAAIRVYSSEIGMEMSELTAALAVWGAQRNLRILGIFARLCLHFGKPHYVDLIPRVWGHLQHNLSHPGLADVARLRLPPPTPDFLEGLKSRCGTRPGP